ncbi:MAG: aminoglycoside phosphotransferase family protein [Rickettsiales bacterium]
MLYSQNLNKLDDFDFNDIAKQSDIYAFLLNSGMHNFRAKKLAGDASLREYYRIFASDGKTYIMMDSSQDIQSSMEFAKIGHYLGEIGVSAPQIIAKHLKAGYMLLEDLGDAIYTPYIAQNSKQEEELYFTAIDLLAQIQKASLSIDIANYSEISMNKEIDAFLEWYVKVELTDSMFKAAKADLFKIFTKLYSRLADLKPVIVLRDFMADNLIWLADRQETKRVGVIDFQDALLGSPAYDLVSLLQDARRDVPADLVEKCIKRFVKNIGSDENKFMDAYYILGAQRNLKIIGYFHRLNIKYQKPKYLGYLPRVWEHINLNLEEPVMAELNEWFEKYAIPKH